MSSLSGAAGASRGAGSALSRRGFLAGATGAIAAGLSACGTGGGQSPRTPADAAPGFPVSIPTKFGTTRIPSAPSSIVTLGITDHDVALPLGVVPEGLRKWGPWDSGVGPWVEPMLRGKRPELFSGDFSAESVIALDPDLITAVQSALGQDQYNRLSSFKPVVAQPPQAIDYGVNWRKQAEMIGKALGKQDEVKKLIGDTQARIEQTRKAHPILEGKTHVTVRTTAKGTYAAYTEQDARTQLLEQLGLRLSPSIANLSGGGEFNVKISKEKVSLLDADVVIVTTAKPTDVAAVRKDPLLNSLPAAKRGAMVLLDNYDLTMALGSSTVSSIPYVLDKLTPQLVEALR